MCLSAIAACVFVDKIVMCCSLKNCLVYFDDNAGSSSEYTVSGLPPILLKPSIKPDNKDPSLLSSRTHAAITERKIKND